MNVGPGDMGGAHGDLAGAGMDLSGSAGGDMTGSGGAHHQIAFHSLRALDGSDAVGTAINIWIVNDDGSGLEPLTNDSGINMFPQYSPDGTQILFVSERGDDGGAMAQNLWIMNADGSGQAPLTNLAKAAFLEASWSPDGTKIVYTSDRALDGSDATSVKNVFNVWVMNANGAGATPLTHSTTGAFEPAWSPDSTRVAYTVQEATADPINDSPSSNVRVVDADGNNDHSLTSYTKVAARDASWSPDGKKVAFYSDGKLDGSDAGLGDAAGDAVKNVWIADAGGSGITPATSFASSGTAGDEVWSPAGRIFFYSTNTVVGGTVVGDLWIMDGDGSHQAPLIPVADMNVWRGLQPDAQPAAWNKDGSLLAFTFKASLSGGASPSGAENVWVVGADGSGLRAVTKLTAAGADCLSPSWRP